MIDHQMSAAFLAVLPLAHGRLFDCCDVLGAFRDAHRNGLPQRERIDRAAGPRPAGSAVTIAHAFGLARRFDFDRSAETFTFVSRHRLTSLRWGRRSTFGGIAALASGPAS